MPLDNKKTTPSDLCISNGLKKKKNAIFSRCDSDIDVTIKPFKFQTRACI